MGHSVHSTGFRLGYSKGWQLDSTAIDLVGRGGQTLAPLLDHHLARFFLQFPSTLYSHSVLARSPFGSHRLMVFFYSHPWPVLNLFFNKRLATTDPWFPPAEGEETPRMGSSYHYKLFLKDWFVQTLRLLLSLYFSKNFGSFPLSLHLIETPPLSPQLLARSISSRLRKGANLSRIVNSFLNLNFYKFSRTGVTGIFFQASGRLSKTQRATSLSFKRGKTPFSTVSVPIAYFPVSVRLKYGLCNLRVWISYNKNEI